MATIKSAVLTLVHDRKRKTVQATVKATINFTPLELCMMKACPSRHFKVKCQLWGADSGLTGSDDFLYTYPAVFYFPDSTPNAVETVTFNEVLGEGVLDEDWGEDEVYGLITLVNLVSLIAVRKRTNQISHYF